MTEHTPGPWELGDVIHNGEPADDEAIIFLPGGLGKIIVESNNAVADAHLIAAATDMLAALKRVVDAIEHGCPTFEAIRLTLNIINAAIAKAEGRTP